jgi:hypothetical protein
VNAADRESDGMMKFLADENFNNDILRGALLRNPALDMIRVQDTALIGADDTAVLAWAASNDRIVLTHDRATMPRYAIQRLGSGQELSGVFVMNDRLPVAQAIDELLLVVECSDPDEWRNLIVYLPI